MCGIAGILQVGSVVGPGDEALARSMVGALRHRGPDAEGSAAVPGAALANARLTILDLSDAGAMPMRSDDGSVLLTYNGELTNYVELKERFKLGDKFKFRSTSDSEVLLRLYEDQGPAFLEHLAGYFAFCLVDRARNKAWVVRDQAGVRPVFYSVVGGKLYFASEIKALLEVPGLDRELDREGLFHFFTLAYIPGHHTPFRGVRELGGGRLVEVDLASGRHEEREYYRLSYPVDERYAADPAATAGELRAVLRDAVARNLRADVPVGLTLSGGIDSSSLLMLARDLGTRLHTFSVKMDDPTFDESAYQRLAVDHAGPVHHEIKVGPEEVLANLEAHMAFLDEPSGDGAAIPMFVLAREARKHVKVLLSGEGGDEVFNAYETHRAYGARVAYRRWVPAPLRALIRAAAHALPVSHKKLSFDFLAKRFTEGAERGVPESHIFWRHSLDDAQQRALMKDSGAIQGTEAFFREAYDALDFPEGLHRISWLDLKYYFIDDLMVKNDRMITAHSMEARFPYVDRSVLEFAAKLPTTLKVKGMEGRWIQKKAMEGLLPPSLVRRKNMGLEMPHSGWFLGPFRATAEKYFAPDVVGSTGILEPAAVGAMWQEHLSRKRDNGRALWCVLNFLVWFDLFVRGDGYKKHLRGA